MALIVYADGSCQGNPGPGGFGVVVYEEDGETLHSCYAEQQEHTTNNEQELKAILYVLKTYGEKEEDKIPNVYTDSAYAFNTFTEWMYNWQRMFWLKKDGKVPSNLDIIKEYFNYEKQGYKIHLHKVKGHANNPGNMLADALASGRVKESDLQLDGK